MIPSLCSTLGRRSPAFQRSTPHASELLTIGTIVSDGGLATSRAHDVLDVIHEIVPYAAAKISEYDPLRSQHHTIAVRGYSPKVATYLDEGFIERDDLYRLMRSDGSAPLRWSDTPFDYRQSESVKEVFAPAGFDEGFSVCLYSPRGRYTGTLHISVDDRGALEDSVMHAAGWMQRLLSPLVDRVAAHCSLAATLSPESSAILVGRDGQMQQLSPGTHRVRAALYDALIPAVSRRWEELTDRRVGRWLWRKENSDWQKIQTLSVPDGLLVMVDETSPPYSLTYRELQVVAAAAQGDTNVRIAKQLGISPPTVAKHLENILDKTQFSSRTELSARASAEGFLLLQ